MSREWKKLRSKLPQPQAFDIVLLVNNLTIGEIQMLKFKKLKSRLITACKDYDTQILALQIAASVMQCLFVISFLTYCLAPVWMPLLKK